MSEILKSQLLNYERLLYATMVILFNGEKISVGKDLEKLSYILVEI
jgi:hypothetical protein